MNENVLKVLCRIRYYVALVGFSVGPGLFWGGVVSAMLEAAFGISQHTALFFVLPSVTAVFAPWAWKRIPGWFKLEKDECWKK